MSFPPKFLHKSLENFYLLARKLSSDPSKPKTEVSYPQPISPNTSPEKRSLAKNILHVMRAKKGHPGMVSESTDAETSVDIDRKMPRQ